MLVYISYAIVPVIVAFFYNAVGENGINKDENSKRRFLIICGIIMFLMIGLRSQYNGSEDSLRYYANWELISDLSLSEMKQFVEDSRMEPVFLYSVWILSRVFIFPQFAFIITGALFSFSVCRFIYKNSDDMMLSLAMYNTLGLFDFMVQGMRQAIAMSICIFALELCKKRKLAPFVLVILFAALYHRSAIFLLVLYPFYGMKLNLRTYGIIGLASILLVASSGLLVQIGNEIVQSEYQESAESGGYIAVAIYVLIIAIALLLSGKKKQDVNYSFFVIMTTVGMVLYVMRYFNVRIVERVSYYFMFGQIIVLPGTLRTFDRGWRQWVTIIVILVSLALCIYRIRGSNMIPYEFFFYETAAGIGETV